MGQTTLIETAIFIAFFGTLWLLLALAVGFICLLIFGGTNHRRIVSHLAMLLSQNVPLTAGLMLAARNEHGRTRGALRRIGQLLEAGLPLAEAVRRGVSSCPAEIVTTIQAAESAGTLPAALRQLDDRIARKRTPRVAASTQAWAYFVVVGLFLFTIASYAGYFTWPKFIEIFKDFGIPLDTTLTRLYVPARQHPVNEVFGFALSRDISPVEFAWPFLIGMAVVLCLALALFARALRRLHPRRVNPGFIARLSDTFRWQIPPFRRIATARALEAELPVLQLAIAAGWPLPDAIDLAADVDANCVWRGNLREWATRVRRGDDLIDSACACGFPDLVQNALRSGTREGDLGPGLCYCQEYYASLVHHWRLLLQSITLPLVTIGLGVLVGLYTTALISSLAALITHICNDIG